MAELIKVNGDVVNVSPKEGTTYTLKELQGYVGGYIEIVYLRDGRLMVVNEDGVRDCGYNKRASLVAPYGFHIYGDILICNNNEIE